MKEVSKSSSSLKSKVYFSFILSFLIFFSIVFFWYLGEHWSIEDDMGYLTAFVYFISSIFFIISSIVGLRYSVKQRAAKGLKCISKKTLLTLSIISLLILSIFSYNFVIISIAKSTNNSNMCGLAFSSESSYLFMPRLEISCIREVALDLLDVNICDEICDVEVMFGDGQCDNHIRSQCVHNIATRIGDADLCLNDSEMEWITLDGCISWIAEENEDISLCEYYSDGSATIEKLNRGGRGSRDYCVRNVAVANGNRELCFEISDENPDLRSYCLENI